MSDGLIALGWSSSRATEFQPYDKHGYIPARISRVDRGGADLLDGTGPVRATFGADLLTGAANDKTRLPTVGDWAAVRTWPDGCRTIEAILSRHTSLIRDSANRTSQGQVLAANVDHVVIVEHLDPDPAIGRVERLLVLAWQSRARPVVVLTKPDLVPDADGMRAEVAAAAPGVDVLLVNPTTGSGLDQLVNRLKTGETVATLGPSGAGKSTLINALAGTDVMTTGDVRTDGKGRHTTKHRELAVIPGVGVLIDTPGLRGVGLVADAEAVAQAFPEIDELSEYCRFRNCSHEAEPGCAVRTAIDNDDLPETRLDSWRKLQREAAFHARQSDARLKADQARIWKRRSKDLRLHHKAQPPRR